MGNSATKEPRDAPPEAAPPKIVTGDDTYAWPDNLYVETRDMAAASFLVYVFGYVIDATRQQDGIKGVDVDKDGHVCKHDAPNRQLQRSFTPKEVKQLIADNEQILKKRFRSTFKDMTVLEQSLQLFQDRIDASGMDRPLTLVEYDDYHQDKEMVYAVAKDDINRRVTLCFRGTDNELAKKNNWLANLAFFKVKGDAPKAIEDKPVWFHGGFYNYIFGATATTEDDPSRRKYDEILDDIMPLLQDNPGYKLYITGHSLGGALASVVAFYLANDDSIPKPVTCITFASPRVGDYGFREATNVLEQAKKLRVLRVVNNNDSIAMMPMTNFYHAGFQIRLYANPRYEPELTYPKLKDSFWSGVSRAWGNSLPNSLNLSYDHGDYRERVDMNRAYLESKDLNALYNNVDLTGYSWASDGV
jgi:hypothetical protein